MLRDKRALKPAGATLLLLVLARRVEFGVLDGAGAGQWRDGSIGSLAIDSGAALPALQALAHTLLALPASGPVARIRVVLADNWLAATSVPWSGALQQPGPAAIQARARLVQAGCALGPGDVIRLDDAPFGAPRLTLGYPAELLGMLTLAASRHAAPLVSVLPLSAAGWALARRRSQRPVAVALSDTGMLVVARTIDGRARIQDLTVRSSPAASAQALWQRLCLRDPHLESLGAVALIDLAPAPAAPPSAQFFSLQAAVRANDGATAGLRLAASSMGLVSALDAMVARPAWTGARKVLLAAGVLLAAAVSWQALQTTRAAHATQATLAGITRPVAVAPPTVNWTAAELPRIVAVNGAIRELNLPFAAILRALEPAPDLQVAVLSVTTASAGAASQAATVKIVAEARTRSDMARYAAFVAERKPFTDAWLTEHELDDTVLERPYRFTLEATWSDQ